jgi:hypothetical protein
MTHSVYPRSSLLARQWAAVTTYLFVMRAPPHKNLFIPVAETNVTNYTFLKPGSSQTLI